MLLAEHGLQVPAAHLTLPASRVWPASALACGTIHSTSKQCSIWSQCLCVGRLAAAPPGDLALGCRQIRRGGSFARAKLSQPHPQCGRVKPSHRQGNLARSLPTAAGTVHFGGCCNTMLTAYQSSCAFACIESDKASFVHNCVGVLYSEKQQIE